ncbi:L,D-transpeptidase family protein [Clostridium sp.]|jgi:peptidoglycan hydrolase-like protein with peptidoglycan-binding domain|uniref:L,D-transpeptidase family protein n=1 Tax=Clostridium sp. TaxID=1506 RepID=UPI00258D2513|nr:L,D-transpeptidase family protein [Clostridium sp.]MDF2504588.1 hypothetical protein [Clostridium sp.]
MKRNLSIGIICIIVVFSLSACGSLADIGSAFAHNLSSNKSTNNKKDASKANAASDAKAKEKKAKKNVTPPTPPRDVLKAGDKGDDVKDIQKKLNKFGYTVGEDGDFGEQTVYAVMDFQHKHGLTTSGIVLGDTLNDLKKDPTPDVMYQAQAQAVFSGDSSSVEGIVNKLDTQSYTNYFVMVNISQQMVYVFNGANKNWKLINAFPCASGTGGTPTVTGHFFVGIKGPQFESGSAVLKYYTQIQGNYLFHSVLFDKKGNLLDGTLGSAASHGCVRLALENAKYIYDDVPIGSGIWIS